MSPQDSMDDMSRTSLASMSPSPTNEAPHADQVRELIEVHMPALHARLRQPLIDEIALRVLELEPDGRAFLDETTPMRLASLLMHVRNVVLRLEQEAADLERSAANIVDAYHTAAGPRQRRAVLERAVEELATSRGARKRDLRALDRKLGIEAIQERYANRRHDVLACIEIGLAYIGGAIEGAVTDESSSTARAWKVLRRSEIHVFLAEQLTRPQRWHTRLACMRSLIRAFELLDLEDRDGSIAPVLAERVDDPNEHPWVQSGALRVLWKVNPSRALAMSRLRLLHADEDRGPHDFVFRRRAVETLGRFADDMRCINLLKRVAASHDPSEYVRIGVCYAVARAIPRRSDLLDMLATLAGLPPGPEETSPRVRAHAMLATSMAVRGCLSAESRALERCVDSAGLVLASALREDADTLVLDMACRQAVEVGRMLGTHTDPGLLQAFCYPVFGSLLRLLEREDVEPGVHEVAAACLEALEIEVSGPRREWTRYLQRNIAATPPGQKTTLALRGPGLPPPLESDALGRTLAAITRRDWGVDVVDRGESLEIRRGDRLEFKRWRLLHEMRSPAPNKRQAHRHTVGRRLDGTARAHSGILDEVTATVVPGERTFCAGEGSWGRHLPLVDDLLGLNERGVRLFSSHGTTQITCKHSPRAVRRAVQSRYTELARVRLASLNARDLGERGAYATKLRELGIELSFQAHPAPRISSPRPVSRTLQALFPPTTAPPPAGAPKTSPAAASIALAPAVPSADRLVDWLRPHVHYFLTLEGNSQTALALVLIGVGGMFLGNGYRRRAKFESARDQIPLSIGGWGSRGKSGTERLKAGLFHGLGYRTYSKTTGCEAMFIHSQPGGPAVEIYAFRPYGKASIWEQRDHIELAAALNTEVFLWECMALNPRYVEILQRTWMRDDIATITNTYPDHEDVQGPAGIDVARAIARFVPARSKLLSTEINFAPVLRDRCKELGSEFISIDDRAGDLLATDLVGLFPYDEHPRNIALVARLAVELDIDPDLAIVTMAQHVVPDLGVLKRFPPVRVRGRELSFINGCSANERTGFLNNWVRTGCANLDLEGSPDEAIVTVVNNRDDRISRSEVFARILVNDTSVDRHVLIGTNLRGLRRYLDDALEAFLRDNPLISSRELTGTGETPSDRPLERLAEMMRRLRIGEPRPSSLKNRLRVYARGVGRDLTLVDLDAVMRRTRRYFEHGTLNSIAFKDVRSQIWADKELAAHLREALEAAPEHPTPVSPEVLEVAGADDVLNAYRRDLARWAVHGELRTRLETALATADRKALEAVTRDTAAAYQALFLEQLVFVDNPDAGGDQIVDICARSVGPGQRVHLMGCQNIKGTGLDMVYRFMAVDAMDKALVLAGNRDSRVRARGLAAIEQFEDNGLMDSGILAARLRDRPPADAPPEELATRKRLASQMAKLSAAKKKAVAASSSLKSVRQRLLGNVESWFDFVDGALRYHTSRRLTRDLLHSRISHPRMALEMRKLYARAKGGWLDKALFGRKKS